MAAGEGGGMNLALIAIVFWLVAMSVVWLIVLNGERDEHETHAGETDNNPGRHD